MKRIFSLALLCVVFVFSLAVPSLAAEDSPFFDVLAYSSVDDSGNYNIYGSNGSASGYFKLPNNRVVGYVDIIVELNSGTSGFTAQIGGPSTKRDLYVAHISGSTYRLYGNVGYGSNVIYLYLSATNISYAKVISFNVAYDTLAHYDTDGYCEISASNFEGTAIHYVPTDTINSRNWMGGSDPQLASITLFAYTENWRKYDYVDFQFYLGCQGVLSVSAVMGNTVLPVTVSTYSNDNGINNDWFVSVRLDCRNINRSGSDHPMIIITAEEVYDGLNWVSVQNISGFNSGSSGNLFTFLFRDLTNNLRTWFSDLKSALSGSTASGDQFKDDSAGLISDLDGLTSEMDSVDRPSMNSVNADFTADISDTSVLLGSLFSEVTSVQWLSRLILASVTMGLIAYILYGKE